MNSTASAWPDITLSRWADTAETLHLWTQIVGKVRLRLSPRQAHCWNCTLYLTTRGLTTSTIPHGSETFSIDFDFIEHKITVQSSTGKTASFDLRPMSVAAFFKRTMHALAEVGVSVRIGMRPNEVANPIRFDEDESHAAYDAEAVHRYWLALVTADRLLKQFRAGFLGKSSPSHYFWGAPDLAMTRFSGRVAPQHPGGIPSLPDTVTRDAYSHEVFSVGFWHGGGPVENAAFYAYAYPEPPGFPESVASPVAYYHQDLREFLLPYDLVRSSHHPDGAALGFFESCFLAAESLGNWDRSLVPAK